MSPSEVGFFDQAHLTRRFKRFLGVTPGDSQRRRRPVTTDPAREILVAADRVEDSFPAWSPDGRFLMWARHGELVVARPDGSGMVEVGPGNFPSWIR